jgi:hypothetical protein
MLNFSWFNSLVSLRDARQTGQGERYSFAGRQKSFIFIWNLICFFDIVRDASKGRGNRARK